MAAGDIENVGAMLLDERMHVGPPADQGTILPAMLGNSFGQAFRVTTAGELQPRTGNNLFVFSLP